MQVCAGLLLVGALASCGLSHQVRLYPGPSLPAAQVAQLALPYSVLLLKVNSEKVDSTGAAYVFLPGTYLLAVMYCDLALRDYPSEEIEVLFEAAAGRRYQLCYEFFAGNETAWRAWIMDVTGPEG